MSEDYTYPTTPTLADLRTRVAELERENAELRERQSAQFERSTARLVDVALDAERQAQRVAELERENAELRAKVEAVQVYARGIYGEVPPISFEDWYTIVRGEVQP